MTEQPEQQSAGESDAEVRSAIAAFEQILHAMPNDRAAMEALYHACDDLGDRVRAADYLFQLCRTMVDEEDFTQARNLLSDSPRYADDARAADLLAAIDRCGGSASEPSPPPAPVEIAPPPARPAPVLESRMSSFNMSGELAFAWNMLEAGDLTQEEYSGVVQDLTEMSVAEGADTVSVLHVLEARSHRGLDRILVRAAEECGTPIVSLSCFDVQAASEAVLPMAFMLRRGALVFELIGNHALVVVLNPYDDQLRRDVETLTAKPCHFYLALPSEFDEALTRLSDVRAGRVRAGD